jgi:hypothetical protein
MAGWQMLRRYRDSWPNTLWPQQPNFKAKQQVKKRERSKREISKDNREKHKSAKREVAAVTRLFFRPPVASFRSEGLVNLYT